MTPARALVAMVRPSHIALIGCVYLAGVLLGLSRSGTQADPITVLTTGLLIGGAAAAAHLVNEAEDVASDRLARRTRFSGGSGALEASGLDPSLPRRLGLALAGMVGAATTGAVVVLALPPAAFVLTLTGLAGALLYSLPPVAAMRRGWGEPLNAGLGGLVLPLAGVAVASGGVTAADVLAFLPFTLVVFASVMATAWPDRHADAATGKRTLQVRWTRARLRSVHGAATATFFGATLVVAAVDAAPLPLAGLVVVPALAFGLATYTRRESPLPNVAAMVGLALVLVAANASGLAVGWDG